jgi:hypothetical protein
VLALDVGVVFDLPENRVAGARKRFGQDLGADVDPAALRPADHPGKI